MADSAFDAREAWNWKRMEADYGPFSEEQIARLNRDRFLLVPQRPGFKMPPLAFLPAFSHPFGDAYDEMVRDFSVMAGSSLSSLRTPSNARLVNPDIMLHAFHRYFEYRMIDLEATLLSGLLNAFLTGIYENALELRARAPAEARPAWDLAIAQMAVPLTLLETRAPPAPSANPWGSVPDPPGSDSLKAALKVFAVRGGDLPPPLRAAARGALDRIYASSGPPAPGEPDLAAALGLAPAYLAAKVDWRRFSPGSNYSGSSARRAYFRAAAWLGETGWRRDDPEALPQIVAWAAALAAPGGPGFSAAAGELSEWTGGAPPASPLEAWRRLMDLASFLAGPHEDPSLGEALEIASSGQEGGPPGPGSPGDAAYLAAVGPAMAKAAPKPGLFRAFIQDRYAGLGVITPLPQRFTLPWLVANELTAEREAVRRQGRDFTSPFQTRFSALYVAEALGSSYADALMPKEVELHPPAAEGSGAEAGPAEGVKAMRVKARVLQAKLASVPAADWKMSVAGAWFAVLRTLAADYPEGYPLYMRSEAFRAKQLETVLGSFTELRHDILRYGKPNYGETGGGGDPDDIIPKRLAKGFVEPNLEFWAAFRAALDALAEGFASRGLFPQDAEEFGRLRAFKRYASRLEAIARKEIAGEAVSEEDYEFLRVFDLYSVVVTDGDDPERALSGISVDIQTISPSPAGEGQALSGGGEVYEGLGPPYLMFALVDSDGERRVCVGLAYNHYEFILPFGARLTDPAWNAVAYRGLSWLEDVDLKADPAFPKLPPKNFWYRPALE
jgi:hypothetical protein